MKIIESYISKLHRAIHDFPSEAVIDCGDLIWDAYQTDKQIFIFGNGGSASTASHFANDFGKGPNLPNVRRPRVMSLTDNIATMTAWSNDVCYEDVFVEQLKKLGQPRRCCGRDQCERQL